MCIKLIEMDLIGTSVESNQILVQTIANSRKCLVNISSKKLIVNESITCKSYIDNSYRNIKTILDFHLPLTLFNF